jgi:hypothetical protein
VFAKKTRRTIRRTLILLGLASTLKTKQQDHYMTRLIVAVLVVVVVSAYAKRCIYNLKTEKLECTEELVIADHIQNTDAKTTTKTTITTTTNFYVSLDKTHNVTIKAWLKSKCNNGWVYAHEYQMDKHNEYLPPTDETFANTFCILCKNGTLLLVRVDYSFFVIQDNNMVHVHKYQYNGKTGIFDYQKNLGSMSYTAIVDYIEQ